MSGNVCDKFCDDCHYFKYLYSGTTRCCHYILMAGKKRPCPPGQGCTAKVKVKVKRKRAKKLMEEVE